MRIPSFLLAAAVIGASIHHAMADFLVVELQQQDSWKFVEVSLPQALKVSGISHDGVYDTTSNKIKWGPLAPALRAVTFTLDDDDASDGQSLEITSSPSAATLINTIEVPIDSDNDGLPKAVEVQLGLSDSDASDASGDLDGDGASNLTEHLAGTDPEDHSSLPTVRLVKYDAATSSLVLDASGMRTDTVTVETAVRLDSTEWQRVPSAEVLEDEIGQVRIPISQSTSPIRFYRLRWGR